MPGPVGGLVLLDAQSDHHVEVLVDQRIDHSRRRGGVIGRVAVDQQIDVGLDIGKHPPDHVALALAAFAADFGTGREGAGPGAVGGVVVVDVDPGIGQGCRKSPMTAAMATSSLKHGMSTAMRSRGIMLDVPSGLLR